MSNLSLKSMQRTPSSGSSQPNGLETEAAAAPRTGPTPRKQKTDNLEPFYKRQYRYNRDFTHSKPGIIDAEDLPLAQRRAHLLRLAAERTKPSTKPEEQDVSEYLFEDRIEHLLLLNNPKSLLSGLRESRPPHQEPDIEEAQSLGRKNRRDGSEYAETLIYRAPTKPSQRPERSREIFLKVTERRRVAWTMMMGKRDRLLADLQGRSWNGWDHRWTSPSGSAHRNAGPWTYGDSELWDPVSDHLKQGPRPWRPHPRIDDIPDPAHLVYESRKKESVVPLARGNRVSDRMRAARQLMMDERQKVLERREEIRIFDMQHAAESQRQKNGRSRDPQARRPSHHHHREKKIKAPAASAAASVKPMTVREKELAEREREVVEQARVARQMMLAARQKALDAKKQKKIGEVLEDDVFQLTEDDEWPGKEKKD